MKSDRIRMSVEVSAPPEDVYKAWLSGRSHGAMTGSHATGSAREGTRFTSWDGYIEGENLSLEPYAHILQAWRAEDFPEQAPPSRLEISLVATRVGTRLLLTHTELPAGSAEGYAQGWREFYFEPMRSYFARRSTSKVRAGVKKAAAQKPKRAASSSARTAVKAKPSTRAATRAPTKKKAAKPAKKVARR
ncbi:MAG: SRPBCC domain-containing protein [Pseudomonadota bacterium]